MNAVRAVHVRRWKWIPIIFKTVYVPVTIWNWDKTTPQFSTRDAATNFIYQLERCQ